MERLSKLTERTQVSVYTSVPQISSQDYNYLHSQDTKIQLEILNEHCSTMIQNIYLILALVNIRCVFRHTHISFKLTLIKIIQN